MAANTRHELLTAPAEHTRCRICSGRLTPILSLGRLYLSDFPASAGTRTHDAIPLDLARCTNGPCGLVQLVHTTPFWWMYQEYWYRSGVNEAMKDELRDVVRQAIRRCDLRADDTVIDIGANDGTLLSNYGDDVTTVAFEPAQNLQERLKWEADVVHAIPFRRLVDHFYEARIITAIAMFYDLEDPHQFLADAAASLADDGVLVIQQAYLPAMLQQTDFTNICHEHLAYYHLRPLEHLLRQHGLEVFDLDFRPINGGSIRTYIQHQGRAPIAPCVQQVRDEEETLFRDPVLFDHFAHSVRGIRQQLRTAIDSYGALGAPVDLYAASTKANTLLQFCGLDARAIRQAWERSPEKWGRYVGTSGIPIVAEEEGRQEPPAALLLGAWQFRDQFVAREAQYLTDGGRVIVPLPRVEVVSAAQLGQSDR